MKRKLLGLLLLGLLVLTACQVSAVEGPSTTSASAEVIVTDQAAAPELYMPRNIRQAFTNGTRSPDGNPGQNYWQNKAEHRMTIEVAPPNRRVSATEEITYYNNSPNPLSIINFKLYLNVHKPEAMRGEAVLPNFLTDGLQIDEFRVNGEVMTWDTSEDQSETTNHAVTLDQPLAPNESITFTFNWHYELAPTESLVGSAWKEGAIDDTTFFLAYFYPRVAVYDDTEYGGWDAKAFTLAGEFYGDFTDYTFEVNVPKNFVVWATGDLLNPDEVLQQTYVQRLQQSFTSDEVITIAQPDEIQDGLVTAQSETVTWKWRAENVRDIAIAMSDHYYWDAGSVVVDPATDRRASVQAAYDEEATDFQQMVEFGKQALAFGSTEYPGVPYPYPKMTVVRGDADEEYPMMANDGSNPDDPAITRFIAAHEILHTWFPFYMGINEQRYPFMDEGWTTAFEYLINIRDNDQAWATSIFQNFRSIGNLLPTVDTELPIITPLDSMRHAGVAFGYNPYGKPALAYLSLKELMGDQAFKASLQEFIARWHGKHPTPWDMFNTFNDTYDQDLTWFFNSWFFEPNYIDLAVEDVQPTDGGYTIEVRNAGGFAVPFDLQVLYADDTTAIFRQNPAIWQDAPTLAAVTIDSDQAVKAIALDVGIFLDAAPQDNVWQSQ